MFIMRCFIQVSLLSCSHARHLRRRMKSLPSPRHSVTAAVLRDTCTSLALFLTVSISINVRIVALEGGCISGYRSSLSVLLVP